MNPDERKAFIKDIVDVMEVRLIAPLRREVTDLTKRTALLEDAKKTHSGQFRAVTKEIIPRGLSDAEVVRQGENAGIADAIGRIGHVVADLGDSVAEMRKDVALVKERQQPVTTVKLKDGKGGTSIRPASLVAAESSVRTEQKQDSIGKVVLETALDTTKAKDNSAAAKKTAMVTLIAFVVQGVILGLWQAYQFIHAAAPAAAP